MDISCGLVTTTSLEGCTHRLADVGNRVHTRNDSDEDVRGNACNQAIALWLYLGLSLFKHSFSGKHRHSHRCVTGSSDKQGGLLPGRFFKINQNKPLSFSSAELAICDLPSLYESVTLDSMDKPQMADALMHLKKITGNKHNKPKLEFITNYFFRHLVLKTAKS